jgi:hypothetical protein
MGHEPVLDIYTKVARGVIRSWTKGKQEGTGSPFMDKARLRAFFKKPSAKIAGELLNLSRNQLRIMMGLPTAHCHLKAICLNWGL